MSSIEDKICDILDYAKSNGIQIYALTIDPAKYKELETILKSSTTVDRIVARPYDLWHLKMRVTILPCGREKL